MENNRVLRLLLLALSTVATVGLSVSAHADPSGNATGMDAIFLDALRQAGISFRSGADAVTAGKTACELLDDGQPDVDVVKRVTELNPGFTISGAAKFTAIAASAYCPQRLSSGGGGGHDDT